MKASPVVDRPLCSVGAPNPACASFGASGRVATSGASQSGRLPDRLGLALIVVIGVLGVLAALAVAFVAMAQLERRASQQRVNGARAYLLARSGIEDALARLSLGQDPAYGGEDWLGDGDQGAGSFDREQEVYRRGELNTADCPARHALRPSFFAKDGFTPPRPALLELDGRKRGYSGRLAGNHAPLGNTYVLKAEGANSRIFINGGALDALNRDPDGPGAAAGDFPPNQDAAVEVAPLQPNGMPDHRDTAMEGPNGFLVRLLDNLESAATGTTSPTLGAEVVGNRPVGGYRALEALTPVLGEVRHARFSPYLTALAWTDPTVLKPQPMDGRPQRWEDIDESHRTRKEAEEISGVHEDPRTYTYWGGTTGVDLSLNPGLQGGPAGPWSQAITATNGPERTKTYRLAWEHGFVYAWSQLRAAPPSFEPRAPVSLNEASKEVLAAVFAGLLGTHLEVWDGSAGWDGGFGWHFTEVPAATVDDTKVLGKEVEGTRVSVIEATYEYPDQATEDAPWMRARADYGMTCGKSAFAPPARPWYGASDYDPHESPHYPVFAPIPGFPDPPSWEDKRFGGKPVIHVSPLGRLAETEPVSLAQARAIAKQIRDRIEEAGAFRTWEQFNAFVAALPLWEDLDDDGKPDGEPYRVTNGVGAFYTRRIYRREDPGGDGLKREIFAPLAEAAADWRLGAIPWQDPRLAKSKLAADQVPGLSFLQKDVLKAMANPNADLNDLNPDANRFKEVDKTDLAGIVPGSGAYAHTTELALDGGGGLHRLVAAGRISSGGRLLALRQAGALVLSRLRRDTVQSDFLAGRWPSACFAGPETPYPLAGGRALAAYPEPSSVSAQGAGWDGQIGLGFIAALPGPGSMQVDPGVELDPNVEVKNKSKIDTEHPGQSKVKVTHSADPSASAEPEIVSTESDDTLRGNLFETLDAPGDPSVSDLRGPARAPLLAPAGQDTGNLFPDGAYSEKDRTLKFRLGSRLAGDSFYVGFWAKANWLPEASPRAHALVSWASVGGPSTINAVPYANIRSFPVGLFFVPARNNLWEETMGLYEHGAASTKGLAWPRRALLWGCWHSLYASDCLNRRGMTGAGFVPVPALRPLGRLEGRRWTYLAMMGSGVRQGSRLLIGRTIASPHGGGWDSGFYEPPAAHKDGSDNHLRFGEIASHHVMNDVADATFANVQAGRLPRVDRGSPTRNAPVVGEGNAVTIGVDGMLGTAGAAPANAQHLAYFSGAAGPGARGRHLKEHGAAFVSTPLPPGAKPRRITWTEIPCDLWFDEDSDGWAGDPLKRPMNDRFTLTPAGVALPVPNLKRDVRIDLEIWDDRGTSEPLDDVRLAHFDDPAADNRIPEPLPLPPLPIPLPLPQAATGRLYYKAVFMNEWDPATRANHPLDVTPFLDDVTILYEEPGGPRLLSWDGGDAD